MHDDSPPPDDPPPTHTKPAEPSMSTHRRLGQLVLVVVEGPDRGKQHLIEVCRGRIVKAGRSATNELVIHDELVSGTHFELLVQDQGIWLRDLYSRNGVYIHGTRVREALLDMERCSASAAPASRSSARPRSACRCRTGTTSASSTATARSCARSSPTSSASPPSPSA
jgi:hypothetical protein